MAPYEALYGRKCRSPLYWDEVGEKYVVGSKMLQIMKEKISLVREKINAAQDWQKSWADLKRRPLEFSMGDKVFLKVSLTKGVVKFRKRGKLNPRFIGPYTILKRIGKVAYRVKLSQNLTGVHNVFYVSQLRQYVPERG